MTILDELAALARERHYGHGPLELPLCRVSKFPIAWCGGCQRGEHRRAVLEHSLREGVDHARDPDYCPVCGPQGFGSCRCEIAASE